MGKMKWSFIGFIVAFSIVAVFIAPIFAAASASADYVSPARGMAEEDVGEHDFTGVRTVTVVAVPGLSFLELTEEHLDDLPNWKRLVHRGQIAALNVRTPKRGMVNSYLTLGAGASAIGDSQAQAWNRLETRSGGTAEDLYWRYNGELPREAFIVVPEIAKLRKLNESNAYGARIGLLGETLWNQGIRTAAFGNSDRRPPAGDGFLRGNFSPSNTAELPYFFDNSAPSDPTELPYSAPFDRTEFQLSPVFATFEGKRKRYAPLMLMTEGGWLPKGDVGEGSTIADSRRPFGVKTNYRSLLEQWKEFNVEAPSLSVIELGDLDRLYGEGKLFDPETFAAMKRDTMAEIDDFLGDVLNASTDNDVLWIVSPESNPEAAKLKSYLTPLIRYQKGTATGLLVSETTRRSGIAANYDTAPTLLAEFGIESPSGMIGIPLRAEAGNGSLGHLQQELRSIEKVYRLRPPILYSLVVYEIIVLLLGLLVVLKKWRSAYRWVRLPLYSILLSPLILLWMGWLVELRTGLLIALALAVLILLSLIMNRVSLIHALLTIGATNTLFITLDVVFDAHAMKHSVLGYDPMIGARYYGIGNEYMGIIIGAVLLAAAAGLEILRRRHVIEPEFALPRALGSTDIAAPRTWAAIIIGTMFILMIVFFFAPGLGTNAGGGLAAAAGFGVAWLRFFGKLGKWGARDGIDIKQSGRWLRAILAIVVVFIATGAGLWLLNASGDASQQSHIGRALRHVEQGDFSAIWRIIIRKLQMNWHLFTVSSWSKVLITSLLVMAIMVNRPSGLFRRWQTEAPYLMRGFSAISVGAVAALLLNDSGIVAAATMIVFVAVPMLLLKLSQET